MAEFLTALANTLFYVYSLDSYNAKLLWGKLDQTHNTDSQGLKKYSVSKFLDFKLVGSKSMNGQVNEFEMIIYALKESGKDLKSFRSRNKNMWCWLRAGLQR